MSLDRAATRSRGRVGDRDDIVVPQPALGQSLIRYHHGHGELFVRPVDHFFNALQETRSRSIELISATGSLVAKHAH